MSDLPSIHGRGTLEDVRAAIGVQPHAVRRLRNAMYKHGLPPREALALLEPATRAAIVERAALTGLDEVRRQDSASDGATKLLLQTRAGLVFESVILRIRSGRSSVCVSAQVGCAVRCEFCATGHMGVVRNLTADEKRAVARRAGEQLVALIARNQGARTFITCPGRS